MNSLNNTTAAVNSNAVAGGFSIPAKRTYGLGFDVYSYSKRPAEELVEIVEWAIKVYETETDTFREEVAIAVFEAVFKNDHVDDDDAEWLEAIDDSEAKTILEKTREFHLARTTFRVYGRDDVTRFSNNSDYGTLLELTLAELRILPDVVKELWAEIH